MILGDSVVEGLNEYGLSKKQNVKIQSFCRMHQGRMLDIVKPAARCKADAIIIQ